MTIKQQGGIFGRNPTFNDVTVDGELNTNSTASVGGDATIVGDLTVKKSNGNIVLANDSGVDKGAINMSGGAMRLTADTTVSVYTDGSPIEGGSLAFDVTTSGNIAFPSGQGIDFSATSGTGTSELFDDYEEGTWTPSYTPTTGSFTTMTYNNQEGYYTKIGDLVYINCLISTNNSNPSGGSGVLLISGLPYTCGASADHSLAISGTINWGGDYPLAGQLIESSSTIKFQYRTVVNGTTSSLDVSDMATSTSSNRNYIRFSGCYKV